MSEVAQQWARTQSCGGWKAKWVLTMLALPADDNGDAGDLSSLAEICELTPHEIGVALAALESRGLIARGGESGARRVVVLHDDRAWAYAAREFGGAS